MASETLLKLRDLRFLFIQELPGSWFTGLRRFPVALYSMREVLGSYYWAVVTTAVRLTNHCLNSPRVGWILGCWGSQSQVDFSESSALAQQKLCAQCMTSRQKFLGPHLTTPHIRWFDWSPVALELTKLERLLLPVLNWSSSCTFSSDSHKKRLLDLGG